MLLRRANYGVLLSPKDIILRSLSILLTFVLAARIDSPRPCCLLKKNAIFYEKEENNLDENQLFSFHAEMVALAKVRGNGLREKAAYLRSIGAFMIIVRTKLHTHLLHESFPCPYCFSRLKNLGIPIYFSSEGNEEKRKVKYVQTKKRLSR